MSSWPMNVEESGRLSTHYGVKVFDIGDQIFVVLGHHEDKKRVVAAMNAHARTQCGSDGLWDLFNFWPSYAKFTAKLEERFAMVLDENNEDVFFESDDPAERVWWPDKYTAATPGAFPVTVWD